MATPKKVRKATKKSAKGRKKTEKKEVAVVDVPEQVTEGPEKKAVENVKSLNGVVTQFRPFSFDNFSEEEMQDLRRELCRQKEKSRAYEARCRMLGISYSQGEESFSD